MKNYTILRLDVYNDDIPTTYSAEEKRYQFTGRYINLNDESDKKILSDFLFCGKPVWIQSVKDNKSNLIYSRGEKLDVGIIQNIFIENNKIYFETDGITGTISSDKVKKIKNEMKTKNPSRSEFAENLKKSNSIFSNLEEKILKSDKERKIRFEKLMRKNIPTNLQDFLIKFFQSYNEEKNTIYIDTKEIQTEIGKRRSLGDIYKICKYYFPDITLNDVLKELYINLPKKITRGFRSCYCFTINKRVWYYNVDRTNSVFNTDTKDEYGNLPNYYITNIT